jgi:hypothetical protein
MNALELTGLTCIAHDYPMNRVAIAQMPVSCNQCCHAHKCTPISDLIASLTSVFSYILSAIRIEQLPAIPPFSWPSVLFVVAIPFLEGGRRDMSVIDWVGISASRACGFRAGRAELINGVSLIAVPYRLELFRARLSVCASGLRSVKRSSAIAHFSDSVCYFAAGPSSTSQAGLPMPLYRFTGNGR